MRKVGLCLVRLSRPPTPRRGSPLRRRRTRRASTISPILKPGTYEVKIVANGLKEAVITGVLVDVGNIARVDTTLQMGSTTQSITVEATAPLVQQDTTTYDAQVNRKFVEDLPNAVSGGTRDASVLVNLVPGAQTPGASSGQSYGSQFGINIDGGRQFSTEWQIDGMNMAYQGVTTNVFPGQPARPWI